MNRRWVLFVCGAVFLVLISCQEKKGPATQAPAEATVAQAADRDLDTSKSVELDQPPVLVKRVIPKYPESAKVAGLEGTVWVKALVGLDGSVKKAVLVKQEGAPEFESSALEAAKQMAFGPAKSKGQPVEFWVTIPFRFALEKSKDAPGLSSLKHPDNESYVEGYLEALKQTLEKSKSTLAELRKTKRDTGELEKDVLTLTKRVELVEGQLNKLRTNRTTRR